MFFKIEKMILACELVEVAALGCYLVIAFPRLAFEALIGADFVHRLSFLPWFSHHLDGLVGERRHHQDVLGFAFLRLACEVRDGLLADQHAVGVRAMIERGDVVIPLSDPDLEGNPVAVDRFGFDGPLKQVRGDLKSIHHFSPLVRPDSDHGIGPLPVPRIEPFPDRFAK